MLTTLIAIWAAPLPIAGALAGFKNRSIIGWLALTLLFPPAILVLALLPRRDGSCWLWRRVIPLD